MGQVVYPPPEQGDSRERLEQLREPGRSGPGIKAKNNRGTVLETKQNT